ncbi:hypothetical protein L1887_32156 [Cichorium endivia]|nr:hypothetical protein L1887_32156 [Cichorium endivia]
MSLTICHVAGQSLTSTSPFFTPLCFNGLDQIIASHLKSTVDRPSSRAFESHKLSLQPGSRGLIKQKRTDPNQPDRSLDVVIPTNYTTFSSTFHYHLVFLFPTH